MPVKVGLRYIDKWKTDLEKEVLAYEAEPIVKGQIVFYGPSHFTRWSAKFGNTPIRDVLLGKSGAPCAVNRGFGSSNSEHQLYYYPRMVRPLEPKVLVYMGDANSTAFGYTVEETWELALRVITYALTDFPDIRVYVCGSMPGKAMTEEDIERKRAYNKLAREIAESTQGCFYIDPFEYAPLRNDDMFLDDKVHLNAEGYKVFEEFFKEKLKDELDRF
jgi:lysophospholipase L1-like esterase